MIFTCPACGLTYDATFNEDYLLDNRVTPKEVVTPIEVMHKCEKRNNKWHSMKRQKEEQ